MIALHWLHVLIHVTAVAKDTILTWRRHSVRGLGLGNGGQTPPLAPRQSSFGGRGRGGPASASPQPPVKELGQLDHFLRQLSHSRQYGLSIYVISRIECRHKQGGSFDYLELTKLITHNAEYLRTLYKTGFSQSASASPASSRSPTQARPASAWSIEWCG